MSKTNIYDFLIEALKAEGKTSTGRYNILITVLSVAFLILVISYSSIEVIVNGILKSLDKQQLESIPAYLTVGASVATPLLFALCLFIVWKMERIKSNPKPGSK